jgi:hypothetical protein
VYAFSIKVKLNSRYEDGVPVPTPGGGWLLQYHQENPVTERYQRRSNGGDREREGSRGSARARLGAGTGWHSTTAGGHGMV